MRLAKENADAIGECLNPRDQECLEEQAREYAAILLVFNESPPPPERLMTYHGLLTMAFLAHADYVDYSAKGDAEKALEALFEFLAYNTASIEEYERVTGRKAP